MAWLLGTLVVLGTAVGFIGGLVGVFAHLDKLGEEDPKFRPVKGRLALLLTALPQKSFSRRVCGANELFFHWFDALFHGKGTLLEQGLWLGLICSPVMLLLIRLLLLGAGEPIPETSRMLLFAMTLAFSLSTAVVAARALRALPGRLYSVLYGVLFGVLAGVLVGGLYAVLYGVLYAVLYGVLIGVLYGVLRGVLYGVLLAVLYGVLVGVLVVSVLGGGLPEGIAWGLGVAVSLNLAGVALLLLRRFSLPVHPLRSLALSLVTVFILGVIMRDASVSFYHLLLQDGPIVLSYVAFNVFADGISLLETRWVLRRSLNLGLLALLGLVLLDLALSAGIFLFLPLVLRELPSFWQGMFFRGSQPWLGILFWSTFSTSALFYLFVGAVLSLILPGHGLARLFHRTVGQMITIESRPFTAIAWGMILLLVVVFAVGWTGAFLYRLAVG